MLGIDEAVALVGVAEVVETIQTMDRIRCTVKNVVCPAHHFAVTPVHTFKLSVAITPNYVVCMHTL